MLLYKHKENIIILSFTNVTGVEDKKRQINGRENL